MPHRLLAASLAVVLTSLCAGQARAELPKRQGDVYVFSDGVQVRATDPAGRAGTASADGTIRWSDGTSVRHDASTGQTRITHADGRVDVREHRAPTRNEAGDFVWSDGTTVRGTDAQGRPGRVGADGVVTYPDGTRASHDTRSGDTKFVRADGSVRLINRGSGTDKLFPGGTSSGREGGTGTGIAGPGNDNAARGGHGGKDTAAKLVGAGDARSNTGHRNDPRGGGTSNVGHTHHSNASNTGHSNAGTSNAGGSKDHKDHSNKNHGAATPSHASNSAASHANDNSSGERQTRENVGKEHKEKPEKGRMVEGWGQPAAGSGARLRVGGIAGNPGDDRGSGGTPRLTGTAAMGPGGRPRDDARGELDGLLLQMPADLLVTNPGAHGPGRGAGTPKPIDAYDGRR